MSPECVNLLDNQIPYQFEYQKKFSDLSITLSEPVVIVILGLKVTHLMM